MQKTRLLIFTVFLHIISSCATLNNKNVGPKPPPCSPVITSETFMIIKCQDKDMVCQHLFTEIGVSSGCVAK